MTSAEYSVEQAQQQLKAAKAAVYDAKENYRVTRDQLEGNITDAEEALRDAEEALGDAQAAYNDAVAGQECAREEEAALISKKKKITKRRKRMGPVSGYTSSGLPVCQRGLEKSRGVKKAKEAMRMRSL